jgi:SARP family transcriptional regulator, regulator of embCAB operon
MLPVAAVRLPRRCGAAAGCGPKGTSVVEVAGQDQALRFEILGPVRAWRGSGELDLGPGKQRAVLAVLLVNANRPVATGQIVDAVWGDDPPENGANVVQKYIAGLRRVLDPDRSPRTGGQLLTLTDAGYKLHVQPGSLDADVFHEWVRQAQRARADGSFAHAADTLRGALSMWRSQPLAGVSGPLFETARERLAESRAAALETWAQNELDLGHHAEVVPELVRLVAELPLREHLRYLLILALYQLGRQAEALAAYRDARAFLVEEFGAEPGEPLQQLHRRILQADPALGTPMATTGVSGPDGRVAAELPEPAVGDRRRWYVHLGKVMVVLTPLLTFGSGTFVVIGFFAARRRSWLLGGAAAGYLALFAVFAATPTEPEAGGVTGFVAGVGLFGSMVGGLLHTTILCYLPRHSAPASPPPAGGWRHRISREQARQLAVHHPEIARELRIGRPDLPRRIDDDGLVDLNAVPEHVVASLPGITPQQARDIVADRERRGLFASPEELVARELVPAAVVNMLRDRLVCPTRPMDTRHMVGG